MTLRLRDMRDGLQSAHIRSDAVISNTRMEWCE